MLQSATGWIQAAETMPCWVCVCICLRERERGKERNGETREAGGEEGKGRELAQQICIPKGTCRDRLFEKGEMGWLCVM